MLLLLFLLCHNLLSEWIHLQLSYIPKTTMYGICLHHKPIINVVLKSKCINWTGLQKNVLMSVMANTRALILYVFVSSFFFFVCLPHFLPSFFPSNSSSRASYQSEKEEVGYLCRFLPYNPCKTFKLKEIHFKKNAFLVKLLHSTFNVLLWCTIKAFLNCM